MADDPWAAFADAPAPAAAPAAAPGGADPWAAFADAPAPAAAPAAAPQAPWTLQSAVLPWLNGAVRSAANSVPIVGAYADKLDAVTDSALTGKSQDKAMADQHAMDQRFADQNPVSAGAAGFAGAAGGSVAMLPDAGLGMVGTLGQRIAGGAAGGAVLGGADSAARGESVPGGAVAGGIGGAAGPLIGRGVGAAVHGVGNLMQAAPDGMQGTSRIATNWLRNSIAGMTPEDYAAAMSAVGPAGMFAEASPGALDLAKSVADQNGPGKAIVRQAFQDRMDGRNVRVNDLVDDALGPAQSPLAYQAGLNAQAGPLAQAQQQALAAAGPVDVSGAYQRLAGAMPNAAPGSPEHAALGQALQMLAEKPQAGSAPSTWERDALGSEQVPDMPADLPQAPFVGDEAAPTRPGPVGVPRPVDLHSFVRSLGGMQDPGGDLAAMGLQKLVARPGQGLGPDAVRQVAAEAGYLGGDTTGAMRNSTIGDLHNALENGDRTFSVYDEDAVHQWAARDAAMADYQQRGAAGADPVARPAGPRPNAPGLPFSGDPGFDPMQAAAMQPTTNAQRIYSARQAIDDRINYGGPTLDPPSSAMRSQQGAYQGIRGALANALREQVPGYAEATDSLAALNRQKDAVRDGVDALGAGKSAIRPDDFAGQFGALSPEEQAAYRVGMRSTVDQALGTRANDFQALRGVTQGDNGWNAQKLGTAFGQDAVDAVNRGIGQETQMARNSNHVIGGSPTNENQQIRRLTSPEGMNNAVSGLADYADNFTWGKMSSWLPPYLQPRNAYNRMMEGAAENARAQLAPHLVKSGAEADALFHALIAQQRQRAALPPPAFIDPLVRALAGVSQAVRQNTSGQ